MYKTKYNHIVDLTEAFNNMHFTDIEMCREHSEYKFTTLCGEELYGWLGYETNHVISLDIKLYPYQINQSQSFLGVIEIEPGDCEICSLLALEYE